MGDGQEFSELHNYWIVDIAGALQKFVEVIQGLSQRLDFLMLAFYKNFHSDHFVSGEVFRVELHSIISISLSSSCEITCFHSDFNVFIEVPVEEFRAFFPGFVETVFPVVGFFENFTGRLVISLFQGVPGVLLTFVSLSLLSIDVICKLGIQLGIFYHPCTIFGCFIISSLTISSNSFLEQINLFQKLTSAVECSDFAEFRTHKFDDPNRFIFFVSDCQLNSSSPNLLKHLSVSEIISVDLEIAFDGLGIVPGVIPSFGLLKFLFWRRISIRLRRFPSHNFFNKVGSVFSGNPEGLLIVSNIEIHLNGELRFSGVDKCRLSLRVFTFINKTSGLVDQNSISGLWLILACDLESGMVISNVLIHTDGLSSLACLDEL